MYTPELYYALRVLRSHGLDPASDASWSNRKWPPLLLWCMPHLPGRATLLPMTAPELNQLLRKLIRSCACVVGYPATFEREYACAIYWV